ncbi:hypothetical protein N7535_009510 [Penicillium sp. DV-2018c]|nr:hypothetical protein N7461_001990 [Penicillium sp. DV-2018c]KAJ5559282.1 hypothetical protein N7535_009510 [Penicillium sp. DV-2018c]
MASLRQAESDGACSGCGTNVHVQGNASAGEQGSTAQWRGTTSTIVTSPQRTHRAADADNNDEDVGFRPEDDEAWS